MSSVTGPSVCLSSGLASCRTGPVLRELAGDPAKSSAELLNGLPCPQYAHLQAAASNSCAHFAEKLCQFPLSQFFLLLELGNKRQGRRHGSDVTWAWRGMLWVWRSELLQTHGIHDSIVSSYVAVVLFLRGATLLSVMGYKD